MSTTKIINKVNVRTSILVVDDESGIRNLLRDFLSGEFKVDLASSANEALDLLEKDKYDIVLSDVNMPEMSGKEFFTECRKSWRKCSTRIPTGASAAAVKYQRP